MIQDWLDTMGDQLANIIDSMNGGFSSLFKDLLVSPKDFINGSIWKISQQISEIIKPIGWALLILFFLIELTALLKRRDFKDEDALYDLSIIFLKMALAKLAMENLAIIINTIYEIGAYAISLLQTKNVTEFNENGLTAASNNLEAYKSGLQDLYNSTKIIGLNKLGAWIVSNVIYLVSMGCQILSKIVIYMRYIEIYIWISIGSLAISTSVSQEYSSIFKNWIKRQAALSIQVILLGVCLVFYVNFVQQQTYEIKFDTLWLILSAQVLLVMMMFQTGNWAKSIVGAN